jgi:dethiobiotin synthetase
MAGEDTGHPRRRASSTDGPAVMPEREPLRGCFVTGTDTGVGKTVVAAAITAHLRRQGTTVRVLKPLITGLDERPDPDWPPDHILLAAVAGCAPEKVVLVGYGPAVSPHLAAQLAGAEPPLLASLSAGVRAVAAAAPEATLIVEGVGGLLVPVGPDADVRGLARELGLPLVVVARPGLGTINHTLLTLEAARSAGLKVAGVVLTPWPRQPDVMQRSNRDTIASLGKVEVATLGYVTAARPDVLAAAGAALPLTRWLSRT